MSNVAGSNVPSRDSGGTAGMLPAERKRATFEVGKLMSIMGSDKRAKMVEDARKLFGKAPFDGPWAPEEDDNYLSYEDVFIKSLAKTAEAVRITRENAKFRMAHMAGKVQMGDLFETNGVASIHFTMFLTFLKTNASKEQQKAWLPLAREGHYFGAYAQTELGHGSNVRGLETLATFDKETDEFIIDSPTLTSMKWWPTGMYACTHAVVFANLILEGKPCGVHGFFLQLRDHDGRLMPGVEVGEIGPKLPHNHVNIGYARFNKVRVPRFNMFQKIFKVTREGKFIAPPPKVGKIKNISMMVMRVMNVSWAARDTSKAATIAVRYSAIRKQGFKDTTKRDGGGRGENTILDYKMQQYRVFKALSLSYMFFWNVRYLENYLGEVQMKISLGDDGQRAKAAEELPELHVTCAGLKAWSTVNGHANIEECRKACGGQGFMRSSGIADLVTTFAEPVTVEGEQVILSLQVGRFLVKSIRQIREGKKPKGSVKYLLREPLGTVSFVPGNVEELVDLFRDRARRVAFRLESRFSRCQSRGMTFDESTNSCAILSYKAAFCHSSYVMARNNLKALEDFVTDDNVLRALTRLLELQLLMQLREDGVDWMANLSAPDVEAAEERLFSLLDEIRPDAVALADAFGHSDYALHSALGVFDGNVYERIYAGAKRSPLNNQPGGVMSGWDQIKGIFDINFLKAGVGQRAPEAPSQSDVGAAQPHRAFASSKL